MKGFTLLIRRRLHLKPLKLPISLFTMVKDPTFEGADKVSIIQFKYSVSSRDDDFRASHAKKTVTKFAAAYLDHKKRYGAKEVRDKLRVRTDNK